MTPQERNQLNDEVIEGLKKSRKLLLTVCSYQKGGILKTKFNTNGFVSGGEIEAEMFNPH